MKRYGNLYPKICDWQNLILAHQNARRGKTHYTEVKIVDENLDKHIAMIHAMLVSETYTTSEYDIFEKVCGEKIRTIYRLPYYPDRMVHHAIMQVLMPIFKNNLIADTYSCVPGRGLHSCAKKIIRILKEDKGAKYCLKIDIKKFYPSIDNEMLKKMLRTKFKCQPTLRLLDNIINSTDGIPIGNYLSQHFANFYLSPFDHWIKEVKRIKYYFRYCDDLVIIGSDKNELHKLRIEIEEYLADIKLSINHKWQVFPIADRGIDFLGYRFFPGYTLLREGIAKRYKRRMKSIENGSIHPQAAVSSYVSYDGWLVHGDTFRLKQKYATNKVKERVNNASDMMGCRSPIRRGSK